MSNPPCFQQTALWAQSHIWNEAASFCFRNDGKLPEACSLLAACFRSKRQVTGCSCLLTQSKIQVKCAELNSPLRCRGRWDSICFSHCLGTKQRESNSKSYRPAWERGSASPAGLVWYNAGFGFRNYLKLCLATLTVLEPPPNWTLPMCPGIFMAARKVIMFLNINFGLWVYSLSMPYDC